MMSSSSSTGQSRKLWIEEEDQKLREGVKLQSANGAVKDWNRIALNLPGRSNKDCRKRWSKISKNVKKGSWDVEEDDRLKEGIKQYGMRWTQVAGFVGTRHADQCAKRWTQSLSQQINQADWTDREDRILLAAVLEKGQDWKRIAESELPGRSKVAIKDRYIIVQNKRHKLKVDPPMVATSSQNPDRALGSPQESQPDLQQEPVSEDEFSDDGADDVEDPQSVSQVPLAGTNTAHQSSISWGPTTNDVELSGDHIAESANWGINDLSHDSDLMSLGCLVAGYAPHLLTDGSSATSPPSLSSNADSFGYCGASNLGICGNMPGAANNDMGMRLDTPSYHHHSSQMLSSPDEAAAMPGFDDSGSPFSPLARLAPLLNGLSTSSNPHQSDNTKVDPTNMATTAIMPISGVGGTVNVSSALPKSSVRTVLELDDIPQHALYQIMSIALENKSRIKVETMK